MKTVYLVRHGESVENAKITPVFVGAGAALTDLGQNQAKQIAVRAAKLPIEVIISSTFKRARDTAEVIANATGLPVAESELFVECKNPTSFEGQELTEEMDGRISDWLNSLRYADRKYEDGENYAEIRQRAEQALTELERREENHILVVTHGFFLRVLVGLVILRDSLTADELRKLDHTLITRNTGITVIRDGADDSRKSAAGWHMLTWNDHAHLG